MHTGEAASGHSCEKTLLFTVLGDRLFVHADVKRAKNPSQSHPGSPRCCCADSLMADADAGPETAPQLRQKHGGSM